MRPRCYTCHGEDVDAELVNMALDKAGRDETAKGVPLAVQVTRWHHDRPGFNLSADDVARILHQFGAPTE